MTAGISRAPRSIAPILLLGVLWTRAVLGDEVLTTNGDRLSGTILNADASILLLRTPYAGVIHQYSRLFPSRWYGAAWFALGHDRFADLRLRTLGGPAVDTESTDTTLRLKLGHEW